MQKEASYSSETLVFMYNTSRCLSPWYHNLNTYCREKLKTYVLRLFIMTTNRGCGLLYDAVSI
jgi:hypothetical protein